MNSSPADGWTCGGWAGQERDQVLAGATLSFRERLVWLAEADALIARLERVRPWIDDAGVVHEPTEDPPLPPGPAPAADRAETR